MRHRTVMNVEHLPRYDFDHVSPMWWGTWAFIFIEATAFAAVIAAYLFLAYHAPEWPLSAPPPDLLWGSASTALFIVSAVPYAMLDKAAHAEDLHKTRFWLIAVVFVGGAVLVTRAFEFTVLNTRYDENAYGSIVWIVLGLHTLHLVVDFVETAVLAALMFSRHGHTKRFTDVSDGCLYWYFIIAAWVFLYVLLYWFPRL